MCLSEDQVVVGGEGGKNGSDRLLYTSWLVTVTVINLRKFRVHPTDGPIMKRPL